MAHNDDFITFARKHLRRLDRNLRLLGGTDTVEPIHDFRVASRRLQEPMAIMGPWLGRKAVKRHVKRLKRVRRALRDVRDIDVLRASFEVDATRPNLTAPDAQRLHELIRAIRTDALASGLEKLDDARPQKVIDELDACLADFAKQAAGESAAVHGVAREQWRTNAGKVLEQQPTEDPDADLHACRIRIKHLRYSTELLRPMEGEAMAELVAACKAMQDALGRWNDHQFAVMRLTALATEEAQLARRADWSAAVLRCAADRAQLAQADRVAALQAWPALREAIESALAGVASSGDGSSGGADRPEDGASDADLRGAVEGHA